MRQLLSLLKNVGSVMLLIILKIFVESVFVNFSFICLGASYGPENTELHLPACVTDI